MSAPAWFYDAAALVPAGWWDALPVVLFGSLPLLGFTLVWINRHQPGSDHYERDAEIAELRVQLAEWEHIAATRTRRLADQHEYIGSLERSVCDLTETVEFYRGEYEIVSTISPCAPRRRRGHCRQGAQR